MPPRLSQPSVCIPVLLEPLEPRRLLSAVLDPDTGLLTITGTASADSIQLNISEDILNVTENLVLQSFSASAVTSISIPGQPHSHPASNLSK